MSAQTGARPPRDGRLHVRVLEARLHRGDDGRLVLASPAVGWLRGAPPAGTVVTGGQVVGALEVLGVLHELVTPPSARGLVIADPRTPGGARRAVGWDSPVAVLDPDAAGGAAEASVAADAPGALGALVLRSPSSGRFYARPSPSDPPFVAPGDVLEAGRTVALLEVMKTFHRVTYGGPGLPERARVVRVLPGDESDLDAGDPILDLEPA